VYIMKSLTMTYEQKTCRRALFASGPGEASWFDKVKGAKEAGMDVTHVVRTYIRTPWIGSKNVTACVRACASLD
jgi:hypothetical protein